MSPALELEKVTYKFPETGRPAITDIDLVVEEGEWLGVIGPTNAGKSTLCYLAMGLAPQFFGGRLRGTVRVFGIDTRSQKVAQLSRIVGLLFQNPFTQVSGARERVDEEVAFGPESHGLERAEVEHRVTEALALVGLDKLADRHPLELSGGQLQRLALAGLLAMRPRLLLLDEPTSQLDPAGTNALFEVLTRLHQQGVTIVMVEQKLEAVAELCPRVIVLSGGRLVTDGSPAAVFSQEPVRSTAGAPAFTRLAVQAGLEPPLPVTLEAARQAFLA
jgi:energy-coupling factor transporter ATP-binding protein EcfA2